MAPHLIQIGKTKILYITDFQSLSTNNFLLGLNLLQEKRGPDLLLQKMKKTFD